MIIIGILLLCGGGAAAIYGNNLNNSFDARWNALMNRGTTDPGSSYIIIGIILAVLGLVLLLYGLIKSSNKDNNSGSQSNQEEVTHITRKNTVSSDDIYVKVDGYYQCRVCGNKQILTNGGKCLNCGENLAQY